MYVCIQNKFILNKMNIVIYINKQYINYIKYYYFSYFAKYSFDSNKQFENT